jgi:site-specific recombinase XerD
VQRKFDDGAADNTEILNAQSAFVDAKHHMLNNGARLGTIQMMLGHDSVNSTQFYTHVAINRLKELLRLHHPRG